MDPQNEKRAFLAQKVPAEYAKVKPGVDALKQWLDGPANLDSADKIAAKRALVGLEDPEASTPTAQLIETVQRAIEVVKLDPNNAAAYFMLSRAMTELGRYDEETFHPAPLRDAVDFAEKSLELAPKVGKAWRAVVEIQIHLKRDEIVADMLRDLATGGFAPGTHALLSARYAETIGNYDDAIQWYERAMGFIPQPQRRGEAWAAEALCYIKSGNKSEAERPFLLALLEGGPSPWIAHNWAVLKYELGNYGGASELNRRILEWDPSFQPAIDFHQHMTGVWSKRNQDYPGAIALQEEKLRAVALPGCPEHALKEIGAEPWKPPRRGTRARTTRTFRTGLEEH